MALEALLKLKFKQPRATRRAFLTGTLTVGSVLAFSGSSKALHALALGPKENAGGATDIRVVCGPEDSLQTISRVVDGPGAIWIGGLVVSAPATTALMENSYRDRLREVYGGDAGLAMQTVIIRPNEAFPSGAGAWASRGVIAMRPNQTELWHIVHAEPDTSMEFTPFSEGVQWRQTAQDDLPLVWEKFSATANDNAAFTLGPGNRADLLVKAPAQPGVFALKVTTRSGAQQTERVLLSVRVADDPQIRTAEAREFPSAPALYPETPAMLRDIASDEIGMRRNIVFTNGSGQLGADEPLMQLAAGEEWRVSNTTSLARTLHFSDMPVQVMEIFDPATMGAPRLVPVPWPWADTIQVPAMIESKSVPGFVTLRFRGGHRESSPPYAYGVELFRTPKNAPPAGPTP
jgi:hypothetical protein